VVPMCAATVVVDPARAIGNAGMSMERSTVDPTRRGQAFVVEPDAGPTVRAHRQG
jgi:hypothetical protein